MINQGRSSALFNITLLKTNFQLASSEILIFYPLPNRHQSVLWTIKVVDPDSSLQNVPLKRGLIFHSCIIGELG